MESSALNRNLTTSHGLPCLVQAPDTSPLGHCSRLPSSLCAPVCSPKVCSQPGRSWDSAEITCKSGLILPFCLHSGSGPRLLQAQMSGSPLGSSSGSRSYSARLPGGSLMPSERWREPERRGGRWRRQGASAQVFSSLSARAHLQQPPQPVPEAGLLPRVQLWSKVTSRA